MSAATEPPGWLVDKSALVRLGRSADSQSWADRIERGLVRIATVTLLEVGYSARDSQDHRAPSVPDLLIAAVAERAGLVVLHQDVDFELIAQITNQPTEPLGD